MAALSRRTFIKLVGQGTVALGFGRLTLTETALAQTGTPNAKNATGGKWSDWEFYYPRKYDEADAKILKDFQAEIDQVNKNGGSNANIKDIISGAQGGPGAGAGQGMQDGIKRGNFQNPGSASQEGGGMSGGQPSGQSGGQPGGAPPEGGPGGEQGAPGGEMPAGGGLGGGKRMTLDEMLSFAKNNIGGNPLFTDEEYAKKTKYGNLIAFPLISSLEVMPAMPKKQGFADYMVVTAHNDTNSYVNGKYEKDGEYFVDLTWWCETYDKYLVEEGFATVKLPKKKRN